MQTTEQTDTHEPSLITKTVEHQNNITFVQEVEKYPCLYNYMVADYNRKDAMDAAWTEIGKKFGISGLECKEKWKNIRSVFVRHLRPLHNRSMKQPRKPYYLADHLHFAVPFLKSSRLPNKDDEEETSRDSPYMGKNYQQYYDGGDNQSNNLQSPKTEPADIGADNDAFPEVHAWSSDNLKRPNDTMDDDFNFMQMKDEKVESHSNKMFLLSLMPDLCSMNDKQKRYFKRKVLELIDNILDEDK